MELFHSANVNDVFSFCGNFGAGCGENCRFMADFGAVKDVLTLAEAAADQTSQSVDTLPGKGDGTKCGSMDASLCHHTAAWIISCGSAQFVRGQFYMYIISGRH